MKYRIVRIKNPMFGYLFYIETQGLFNHWSRYGEWRCFHSADAAEQYIRDAYEPLQVVKEGEV